MKTLTVLRNKDYLLISDFLWDGCSGSVMSNQAVLISNGLIKQVLPAAEIPEHYRTDCITCLQLEGLTLMPGLVDCHVHFSMNSENLFQAIDDWNTRPDYVMNLAYRAAVDYLNSGVLAVRDGGDKANIGLQVRNAAARGDIPGPLITATGQAIYKKGKYGKFLGPGIDTVQDAISQINEFRQHGIDQLKVVVSGLVSFKDFGVVGPVQFSVADLGKVVDYAHAAGIRVMAHASSAEAVDIAVIAGVDSVEHGYFLEKPQLELMAARGTAWVPTLAPLGNLACKGHLPYPGADLNVIRQSFELQVAKLKEAHQMGVMVGVGTDAGANHVYHGVSYHDELNYYSMAGLSNLDILRMATSVSSAVIGRNRQMGTVSKGHQPFLLAVAGNPLNSLSCLSSPRWVIMPQQQ